ncbi:MAG: amylo-alpha-1,6-glucosidase [Porticoccaceae bacterium]|nr:MAG: amylo-alpha-1,6-glucosidase [Porticoccaceae bacterium]
MALEEALFIGDQWYIPASSSRADDRVRVLKSDDGFAVFSRHGEIGWAGAAEQGFYFRGTRHLSRWLLTVEGEPLLLLNSAVRLDNSRLVVDQTTPDLCREGRLVLPRGSLHLRRELAMAGEVLSERLTLANYHHCPLELELRFDFAADFADLFEVRGVHRPRRGEFEPPHLERDAVTLGYVGLDGRRRLTRIAFAPSPQALAGDGARFALKLAPGESRVLEVAISAGSGDIGEHTADHGRTVAAIERRLRERAGSARLTSDNEHFDAWLARSRHDLELLLTQTPHGLYPYAGIPWFATPFGRDGLITALETLWLDPDIARGVLSFLAATQARETDPAREAEPGKILHEWREGEMAALGEIPFARYYGSVDATPLFVILADRYFRHTADRAFLEGLWPAVAAALEWIGSRVARDGWLCYARSDERGLVHQGWKDSADAVFHRNGRPAVAPIALCEVQGYAVAALEGGARLAAALGQAAESTRLALAAAELRNRLEAAFWLPELDTYALALDGRGQPCAVRTSNPFHLLYCGAARADRAARLAAQALGEAACSGWGLRTLYRGEPRYNPMSYHNGSVWPHDTAIATAGLARYGHADAARRLAECLFDAAVHLEEHRLPELLCGFERLPGQAPTLYPGACAPQAWAAGSAFLLLEALLGVEVDAAAGVVHLRHPTLPRGVDRLRVEGLPCGRARLDLEVHRHGEDVAVKATHRTGEVKLVVEL